MEPTYDNPQKAEQHSGSEESLKPFASISLPSPSVDDPGSIDYDDRKDYPYSIEKAENHLLNAGYIVAPRTLSNYCQTSQFQCKKFSSEGVRRWFIKESSITRHLKRLKQDQPPNANERKPSHANSPPEIQPAASKTRRFDETSASESNEYSATAMFNVKYVKFLEDQVSQKDSQLKSLQEQSDQVTKLTNGLGMLLLNQAEKPSDRSRENNHS